MKYNYIFISLCIILCGSCSDFLDTSPKEFMSDDDLWATTKSADLFLNDIYNVLHDIDKKEEHLEQYSDNSDVGVIRHHGYKYIGQAQITPTDYPNGVAADDKSNGHWEWKTQYENIRKCNVFILKVNESDLPDDYKTQRVAEARFLRAYFYHKMWMAYGGVSIITVPLSNQETGSQIEYPRSTAEETFKFITSELEAIYSDLPTDPSATEPGRATRGAALALKGWTELFFASPLLNPDNDMQRWTAAAKTNKMVMDLNVYELMPDFETLFLENNNKESIFARQYGPNKGHSMELRFGPVKVGNVTAGWGNFMPTQDLVDEFSMENGKTIYEEGSGYDPKHPYVGREPRFYQTVVFDGDYFHGELMTMRIGGNNEINPGYSSDNTHTGYYGRKRLNEEKSPSAYGDGKSYQNYVIYRYGEVLLSYAEAENEVNGPTKEALDAVNQVRTRNGNLPSIEETYGTVTKDQLRTIIHRERRIELCFEDKRWWDILRWKIAEKMPDGSPGVMNKPLRGMKITENADGTLNYEVINVRNRTFLPKMYRMPIPQEVIDRNSEIAKQNGGPDNWTRGQNPGY